MPLVGEKHLRAPRASVRNQLAAPGECLHEWVEE